MSNRREPNSPIRKALANKTSLTTRYLMPIAPQEQIETARRKLQVARQLEAATLIKSDEDTLQKVAAAVARADAEYEACFHAIEFRGLGVTEFDALVALHPPTAQQKDRAWNPETFDYALLEAAALDSDLSASDWEKELADEARWPAPERNRLVLRAVEAQRQTMADAVPKG